MYRLARSPLVLCSSFHSLSRSLISVPLSLSHSSLPRLQYSIPASRAPAPASPSASSSSSSSSGSGSSSVPPLSPLPVRYSAPDRTLHSRWVDQFNQAISHYPLELIAALATLEATMWISLKSLFTLVGIQFSSSLLLAYGGTWAIRKIPTVKLLLSSPFAAAIHVMFPALKYARLMDLFTSPPAMIAREKLRTLVVQPLRRVLLPVINESKLIKRMYFNPERGAAISPGPLTRGSEALKSAVNRYGMSLFLAYRLSGSLIVLAAYSLMDTQPDKWPIFIQNFIHSVEESAQQRIGSRASDYVGAVVVSGFFFPLCVAAAPKLARLIASKISSRFRKQL